MHVFSITLTATILKKLTVRISLLWALCNIFWSVLGILLNVPRNLKHSFHTLHECLGVTDMQ